MTVLPCLYLWTRVTQRFGPRRALLAALASFAVALLPLAVIDDLGSAIAVFLLAGIGLAGLLMLPDLLVADVVDEDELRTGLRREGMYFGVNGFVIRFAVSIQSLVLTQTLHISGYAPDLPAQPGAALLGLRLLMSAVPLLGLLAALLATRAYPLDGDRLAQVKAQVASLHDQKRAVGGGLAR